MPGLNYVKGSSVHITRAPGSIHARVELPDRCVISAVFKRAFPLSVPGNYLSIQASDGQEVAIVRDLDSMPESSREMIETELNRRYFTPEIQAIDYLKQEAGMWHFKVETHRGPADFYVRNWRDSAQEIAPNRWQIHSVDGARFEIKNLDELGERSKGLLDQLL